MTPQDAPKREREAFVRPNGKPYRPRKPGLRAKSWQNEWGTEDYGVIVFGSLDPDRTHPFAEQACRSWSNGDEVMHGPQPGWWRVAMRAGGRQWVDDPVRGAPGVMWTGESPEWTGAIS